jgi:hypothetical protein
LCVGATDDLAVFWISVFVLLASSNVSSIVVDITHKSYCKYMWLQGRGKTNFNTCALKQTDFQPVTRKHNKAPWTLRVLFTDQDTAMQQYGFRAMLDCPRTEEHDIASDGARRQITAYRKLRKLGATAVCKTCPFAGMSPVDYIRAKTTACQDLAAMLRAEMLLDKVQAEYEAHNRAGTNTNHSPCEQATAPPMMGIAQLAETGSVSANRVEDANP